MTRTFVKLALSASLAILASPSDVFAGRGGGRGGGYGGESRGGYGGQSRGGYGGESRSGYGGGSSMSHSPSFSQPHSSSDYGNRDASSNNPNAKDAAAGAGASNRNQSPNVSNAGAAAAGAGAANRNQSDKPSNAGAAAAGAGYSNRNQSPNISNAGAAAAGAGYANRNQSPSMSNAGAAAAGAGAANRNQYDQYHPGMAAGTWNGNYGAGMGAYGGMGMASPVSGAGGSSYTSPYMNPYASGGPGSGAGGGGQPGGQAQPGTAPTNNPAPYDYTQPVNTAAAPPATAPSDPGSSPASQARQAFQAGDYTNALQLTQQAIGQMPNDISLHEFLALVLFAQGQYEQSAAPLYAVLSAGPGWNWTTLIGNYSDAGAYSQQLRGLEAFVKANPKSAKAQFVLAYHYICQGQGQAAIRPLQNVVTLQPDDKLSARLIAMLQPQGPVGAGTAIPPAATN